jgi:hypothetical protein
VRQHKRHLYRAISTDFSENIDLGGRSLCRISSKLASDARHHGARTPFRIDPTDRRMARSHAESPIAVPHVITEPASRAFLQAMRELPPDELDYGRLLRARAEHACRGVALARARGIEERGARSDAYTPGPAGCALTWALMRPEPRAPCSGAANHTRRS